MPRVTAWSPLLLARAAIVDLDLLTGPPPRVVAASGLDAFAQLVEIARASL